MVPEVLLRGFFFLRKLYVLKGGDPIKISKDVYHSCLFCGNTNLAKAI